MRYILNVVYLLLLLTYLPIVWFQRVYSGKKRPGLWTKFIGTGPVRQPGQKRVLFHAVSLGEINAIRQLVVEFSREHPDWEVVVSTTTQTGLDAAKRHFPDKEICLLPFDFTWSVRRFLTNLKPDALVLAELELWPNLLRECRQRSIQTCVVNARINDKSLRRYQRLEWLSRKLFQNLDLVCCQHDSYAQRFGSLGVPSDRIQVTGNLKYDSLIDDRQLPEVVRFREMIGVNANDAVWIAGSTQAPEEQIVIDSFLELKDQHPNLRLLICPRHPERFDEVASLLESQGIDFSRRSLINEDLDSQADQHSGQRVVLLDCMGELGYWWGVGQIAFVGGSFGNRGGQNMIEPLALGNAVCFGPRTRNFAKEVDELKRYEAAVQLNQPSELTSFVEKCLRDEAFRFRLVEKSRAFLRDFSKAEDTAWSATLAAIDRILYQNTLLGNQKAA